MLLPPATKFAKVMFTQVFVCPRGVSVQGEGSFCPGGSLPEGGSLSGRPLTCEGYASYWNTFFNDDISEIPAFEM